MNNLLEEFQSQRAALYAATGKRPARYPDSVRHLAVSYLTAALASGVQHGNIARALGIDPNTLTAWAMGASPGQKPTAKPRRSVMQRVVVVNDTPAAPSTLCVLGPKGLRVEGATIEQVAALFERLAC